MATGLKMGPWLLINSLTSFSYMDRSSHTTTAMAGLSHKKRDRTRENFTKSCKSGAAHLDKLNRKYGAHVYLQVQWKGKYYEYSSHEDPRWQKTGAELETTYPLPVQWTSATFMKRYTDALPDVSSGNDAKTLRRLSAPGKAATAESPLHSSSGSDEHEAQTVAPASSWTT